MFPEDVKRSTYKFKLSTEEPDTIYSLIAKAKQQEDDDDDEDWEFEGSVELNVDLVSENLKNDIYPSFEFSEIKIKWKKVWFVKIPYPTFTTGHGTLVWEFDHEVGYALQLVGKGSYSKEVTLAGTPKSHGAYASIYVEPGVSFNMAATYQRYLRLSFKREVGLEFVSVVPSKRVSREHYCYSASGNYFEGGLQIEGAVMLGAKAGFKVGGLTVMELKGEVGPYLKFEAQTDYASLKWNRSYGEGNNTERYRTFVTGWKKGHGGISKGANISLSGGIKYEVNFKLLKFVDWSPIAGEFKLFDVGAGGTVLGDPLGDF